METTAKKISVYKNESIFLVGNEQEMYNLCIWLSCALREAANNANNEGRPCTSNSFNSIGEQFSKIAQEIETKLRED